MKLDKEFLTKNRFWVLLATSVALWAASLLFVLVGPAATAAKVRADFAKSEKDYKPPTSPKNEHFLPSWNKLQEFYKNHKYTVWKQAWDGQNTHRELITWPDALAARYARKDVYFGDKIDGIDLTQYRENFYKTQFLGPDGKISRAVFLRPGGEVYLPVDFDDAKVLDPKSWTPTNPDAKAPDTEEAWLAQEEIWVRRELLLTLRDTLHAIGKFTEARERDWDTSLQSLHAVGGGAFDAALRRDARLYRERPLSPQQKGAGIIKSRLFKNRNWTVELLIAQAGAKVGISAESKIMNTNPDGRSLPLVNAAGRGLLLRIKQGLTTKFLTRIEGKLLQPGGWVTFGKATPIDNINLNGDFELEEVFEPTTSPIRRLEAMHLGKEALAHRVALISEVAQNDRTSPKTEVPEGSGTPGQGGFGGPGGGPGGPGGGPGGPVGGPGGPVGGPGGPQSGKSTSVTPFGIDRARYVLCNDQVRRIPIAMVVVIDQSNRNDLLAVITNSRLRIQTTQVYWRHREGVGGSTTNFTPPDDSGTGPVLPPKPGGGPMGPMGDGGKGSEKDAADSQAESSRNLVELTIHGVASLFERFPPREASTGTGQPGGGQPGGFPMKP